MKDKNILFPKCQSLHISKYTGACYRRNQEPCIRTAHLQHPHEKGITLQHQHMTIQQSFLQSDVSTRLCSASKLWTQKPLLMINKQILAIYIYSKQGLHPHCPASSMCQVHLFTTLRVVELHARKPQLHISMIVPNSKLHLT